MPIAFHPLGPDDLAVMHRWLNDPEVVQWWEGDDVSWAGVVHDYSPEREPDGVKHWIASLEDHPIGWISCSDVARWAEEIAAWTALGADPRPAGIDYLIGDRSDRGRGLGARMIAAFVGTVVFGPGSSWIQVGADPFTANARSWRALARCGFQRAGVYGVGAEECTLMLLDRIDLELR